MSDFTETDYIFVKSMIKKSGEDGIPADMLKQYHEYYKKLHSKKAKIFKLTKEQTDKTESKMKQGRIVKYSMFKESGVQKVLNSLRKDNFINELLKDDDEDNK